MTRIREDQDAGGIATG